MASAATFPVVVKQATVTAHGAEVHLMAQRYANCIWVVITQYGKIGNLVHAVRGRSTVGADTSVYDLHMLLGRQDDDLALVYARQVAETIATAATPGAGGSAGAPGDRAEVLSSHCPLLLGVAMRDRSPEAFRDVLAGLDQVRVW